jgi:hypothetical protein
MSDRLARTLGAAHPRHREVDDHQVDLHAVEQVERRAAAPDFGNLVAELAQRLRGHLAHRAVVINQQDARFGHNLGVATRSSGELLFRRSARARHIDAD